MAFCLRKVYNGSDVLKFGNNFIRYLGISEGRHVSTGSNTDPPQSSPKSLKDERNPVVEGNNTSLNADADVDYSRPFEQKNASSSYEIPGNIRFRYPEFLPQPHIPWRNPIKEKLERQDMLTRRSQILIPEFYVGSIMKVVKSNVHQHNKTSEFVGICIRRDGTGLRAGFSLRNTIDNLGVEINYLLYDPTIQSIEVLRLEKRLDDDLGYLRDAYPEYCTIPFDMKPEVRRSDEVPVNPIKVKLKPRPWFFPWHKRDYKGIENIESLLSKKMILKHQKHVKPWEKYDLMQEYRRTIPEEEQMEIYSEVLDDVKGAEMLHRKKRK